MIKRLTEKLIERPPLLHRLLIPGAVWRCKPQRSTAANGVAAKTVYLTFDDGPIPHITPWVLATLRRHGVHATFFMVGDNVARNPVLAARVAAEGHAVGNHTMHHTQGMRCSTRAYIADILEAGKVLPHARLFRPPHGLFTPMQQRAVSRAGYRIVMHDLVTMDYDRRQTPGEVLSRLKRLSRTGSIIVFHDSIKAWPRMSRVLPQAIEWLKSQGYEFRTLGF